MTNWKNLTQNRCPKCSNDLNWNEKGDLYCACGFQISQFKFKHIVADLVDEELKKKWTEEVEE